MKARRKPLTPLRESARGAMCMVSIPGHCNFNAETTVLAHLNTGGMAQKEIDIHSAFCCSGCHDALDGRVPTKFSADDLKMMHYEAVLRNQKLWLQSGLLTYKGQPDMKKMVFYGLD